MKLEFTKGEPDTFAKHTEFAYKNGEIYDIFISEKTYTVDCYIGKMRAIIKNGEVLKWVYPMFGGGEYEIINEAQVRKFRDIVWLYDQKNSN